MSEFSTTEAEKKFESDFKFIKAIRCKATDWNSQIFKFAEIKYDGVRVLIKKDVYGNVSAFQKKWYLDIWYKLQGNVNLVEAVKYLPNRSIVEGEAHNFTNNSEMSTILAEGKDFYFQAFALPVLEGKVNTRMNLIKVRQRLAFYGFNIPELLDFKLLNSNTREGMLEFIKQRKIEGLVMKLNHYGLWYKLKPAKDMDCVIIGTKDATKDSQYDGLIGSLEVALWQREGQTHKLVTVANVSGMDTKIRKRMTAMHEGEDLIGRVLEIRHDGWLKDKVRFPRFLRFREDKSGISPEDCGWDQLGL